MSKKKKRRKKEKNREVCGKMFLTRAQIEAVDDRHFETVDVPEWGGELRIASLSFAAAQGIFKEEIKDVDPRLRLIAACLVDDAGAPLLSEEDLSALGMKDAEVIARIWKKCVEINGMKLKSDADGAAGAPKSADKSADGGGESSNG
jgi:hypothetical protein